MHCKTHYHFPLKNILMGAYMLHEDAIKEELCDNFTIFDASRCNSTNLVKSLVATTTTMCPWIVVCNGTNISSPTLAKSLVLSMEPCPTTEKTNKLFHACIWCRNVLKNTMSVCYEVFCTSQPVGIQFPWWWTQGGHANDNTTSWQRRLWCRLVLTQCYRQD